MTKTFFDAFLVCALWSSIDNDGNPLDREFSISDFAPETLAKLRADCEKFYSENNLENYPDENAGHDFWLSRNHHGAGFFENDFGTAEQCEKLTESAHKFGEVDLYIGDDGQVWC